MSVRRGGSGTTVNTYDDYGVPGSGNTGRFGYTGQTWVPELGMWYYKARMYSRLPRSAAGGLPAASVCTAAVPFQS